MNPQFLVENNSALGKKWRQKSIDDRKSLHMMQKFGISEIFVKFIVFAQCRN